MRTSGKQTKQVIVVTWLSDAQKGSVPRLLQTPAKTPNQTRQTVIML